MNINRDYIINISLAKSPTKGKITIPKDVIFYETDLYTQNIYLIADINIEDLEFVLAFRYNNELIQLIGTPVSINTVEFELPNLTVAGRYVAEIVAKGNEGILVCDSFSFVVRNSIVNGGDING